MLARLGGIDKAGIDKITSSLKHRFTGQEAHGIACL